MHIFKNSRFVISALFFGLYILNIFLVRSLTGAAMTGYIIASSVLFTLVLGCVLFVARKSDNGGEAAGKSPEPAADHTAPTEKADGFRPKKAVDEYDKKVAEAVDRRMECLQDDITELQRKLREEYTKNSKKDQMMIRQSRLAAMGEMISNIAHQWRQPLNALALTIQDIEDSYKHNEITDEYINDTVDKSMELIQHMSVTIDDFRNFYKANKDIVAFSLSRAIDEAMKIISASLKNSSIDVVIERKEDVTVRGYPNEFSQVILNILSNSKDALLENTPTGREIVITIDKTDTEKGRITITDNGGGIPGDIVDNVFDPYFTTKEQGKGTGIGLYMSKTIIESNMGGKIDVYNTGSGTKVILEL